MGLELGGKCRFCRFRSSPSRSKRCERWLCERGGKESDMVPVVVLQKKRDKYYLIVIYCKLL